MGSWLAFSSCGMVFMSCRVIQNRTILYSEQEKAMKSPNFGAVAVAAVLCAMPISLSWSRGNDISSFSISAGLDAADAADLSLPIRHHRAAVRYRYRGHYARLYNPYCNGPYTGGGFNGGTYYGGPWMDLRCYRDVY
jgi:hypothetical protein